MKVTMTFKNAEVIVPARAEVPPAAAKTVDKGEERRALSHGFEVVAWPPRVGERVHFNSGWPHTSWTADVRAIVDDEVAVVFRTCPASGHSRYALLDRIEVMVWTQDRNGQSPLLHYGPLPKALCIPEGR